MTSISKRSKSGKNNRYYDLFQNRYSEQSLTRKSIRSGAITMGSQAAKFAMQIGSTMILARLLSPADFGLLAMVTAVTGMVVMFKDLGLSIATIQQSEINHQQVSTLFWINLAVSSLMACLVALAAPAIAWFYKDPRLTKITLFMSLSFILGGLSIQHSALMKRQMKFGVLETIEIVSLVIGLLSAVLSALSGFGYWALVIMQLTTSGIRSIGIWIGCAWLPGLPRRGSGVRKMLKFGLNVTGFDLVNYFARNMDNILIGRFHGSVPLGLYAKAYQIMMLPIKNLRQPLLQVSTPALSKLQDEPTAFKNYYINYLNLLSLVSMPLVAFLFVCSKEVILFVFGQNWLEMDGIFKALSFAGFIQPVATSTGLVMLSLGQGNRYFKWGLINSVLVVISFFAGLPWGALGIATAYAIINYLVLLPSLIYAYRATSIKCIDFFVAIWRPFLSSMAMAVIVLWIKEEINLIYYQSLPLMLFLGLAVFCIVWILLPEGYETAKKYWHVAKLVVQKKY